MGNALAKTVVFQPPQRSGSSASSHESRPGCKGDSSHLWLSTRRGSKIEAFFIDRGAHVTLLFSHANAEDVSMIYSWLRELSLALRVNVAAYSYTGYAASAGTPSEEHVYADVDAMWTYLTEERALAHSQIVLYSRSIGSGAACYLARRLCAAGTPPAGLVLQSPILSVFRIAFHFRATLPGDLFPNVDRMPEIECPVFVLHGTHDEVVPFWHGQELFLRTQIQWRHKPFWIAGAGLRTLCHNNIEMLLRDSGLLFRKLREFLDTWVVDARAEAAQSGHIPAQRRSAGPDAADRGGDAPAPTPTGLDA